MAEEAPTASPPSWTKWVDSASKLGALSLAAVYAIGYLITSIRLASIGMGFANPLKPRTAAAGVLFCLLFGIPLWLSEQVIIHGGLPIPALPQPSVAGTLYRFSHLFQVCFLLALPLSALFAFTNVSGNWRLVVLVALTGVESAFVATARNSKAVGAWVPRHVVVLGWVYFGLTITYFAVPISAFQYNSFSWIQVPLWLFGCGVYAQAIRPPGTHAWPQMVAQSLMPIYVFGAFLYPHIKSEWGGGQPVDITARFTRDSSLYGSQKVRMQLIDEGDTGFYVLVQNQKHILFIPRSDIAAISYSNDASDLP